MKIVFDTSVLIAAFYQPVTGPSFSREVYDYVVQFEEGIISAFILKEFREKCVKKLKLSGSQALALESLLRKKLRVETLEGHEASSPDIPLRDPKDRPILDLAMAVRADLLLTWDKDLLTLKSVGRTAILTPRAFWDSGL